MLAHLIFIIIMALIALLSSPLIRAQTSPPPEIVTEKKAAPEFKTEDLIGLKGQFAPQFAVSTLDGAEINLETLRGKIVVVNLWATFCPPCITEMPQLNSLAKKYASRDVVFLAPTPDDKAALPAFLKENPFDYQILPNGFGVVEKYAPRKKSAAPQQTGKFIMLLPTHLVIDRSGIVTYHEWGFRKDTADKIGEEIERLLALKS